MATIVERVQNLISGIAAVKAAFKTALTDKGVTVADELKLKDYPPLINDIQVESGEEIIAELNIVVTEEEPTNPVEGLIWIYESGAPDTFEPDIGGMRVIIVIAVAIVVLIILQKLCIVYQTQEALKQMEITLIQAKQGLFKI